MSRNRGGDILLVKMRKQWVLPGGAAQRDEAPHDAASRRMREMTGLGVRLSRLLLLDYAPASGPDDIELSLLFTGTAVPPDAAALDLQDIEGVQKGFGTDPEVDGFQYIPVDDLAAVCSTSQHTQITAALELRGVRGRCGYRVEGRDVFAGMSQRIRPSNLRQEPAAVTFARKSAGLSKRELARRVGMSEQFMGEIESGWRSTSEELLIVLAAVLDCPLDVLQARRTGSPGSNRRPQTS